MQEKNKVRESKMPVWPVWGIALVGVVVAGLIGYSQNNYEEKGYIKGYDKGFEDGYVAGKAGKDLAKKSVVEI